MHVTLCYPMHVLMVNGWWHRCVVASSSTAFINTTFHSALVLRSFSGPPTTLYLSLSLSRQVATLNIGISDGVRVRLQNTTLLYTVARVTNGQGGVHFHFIYDSRRRRRRRVIFSLHLRKMRSLSGCRLYRHTLLECCVCECGSTVFNFATSGAKASPLNH